MRAAGLTADTATRWRGEVKGQWTSYTRENTEGHTNTTLDHTTSIQESFKGR